MRNFFYIIENKCAPSQWNVAFSIAEITSKGVCHWTTVHPTPHIILIIIMLWKGWQNNGQSLRFHGEVPKPGKFSPHLINTGIIMSSALRALMRGQDPSSRAAFLAFPGAILCASILIRVQFEAQSFEPEQTTACFCSITPQRLRNVTVAITSRLVLQETVPALTPSY